MKWVIAYDIGSDRSRRRVARRLEQVGFRRQKSVFEGEASPPEIAALLRELAVYLELDHDVLTAWPMVESNAARIQHEGVARSETYRDWLIL